MMEAVNTSETTITRLHGAISQKLIIFRNDEVPHLTFVILLLLSIACVNILRM
jgi:hypothetical protein